MSQILADQGDFDAALTELTEAIKQDPHLSVAFAAAGDIHRKRGNYEVAKHYYETACQTNPYAFKPQYNLAVTYQLLAESCQSFNRAQQYLRQAVKVYLRAITIQPEDFDANLNIGACYFQMGKYELAEQYCKEAVRIDGDSPQAWSNLGIIYDSQNHLYEAVKAYKQSLEIDTNQPNILLNLGSTYMRQNRIKAALRAFEVAAKHDPQNSAAWEQMGRCLYYLEHYDKSLACYEKSVEFETDSPTAYRGIGVVYMTKFILEQAQTNYREKGLEAWNVSLEIQPEQDDLIKLVKKYSPKIDTPQL